jgi:hypothetical protein
VNRRIPVLVLLAAFVVAGIALDRDPSAEEVVAEARVEQSEFPMAPADTALASTWFCAGGTADSDAFADHVVTMLNTTERALDVDLTAFPGTIAPPAPNAEADALDPEADPESDPEAEGEEQAPADETEDDRTDEAEGDEQAPPDDAPVSAEPVERRIEIAPRSRVRLAMTELVTAPVASALVESDGGGLVVEHEVRSIHGIDAKPCATGASDEWHFAWGTTARESRELLVLFNPFPDDAIVEGVFSTEDTVREPGRFAGGLVVPGRSTVGIDLGDDVTRREEVAATLRTRAGRLVVDRIVRVNEEEGDRGLTVQLGVPEPQRAWIFADGVVSDDFRERFVVYNPTEELAEVEIGFRLDRPEENGIPAPVELSIAPGSHATVDMNEDGRLPANVPHSVVVRSANDVPVVAERVLSSRRPEGRRGLSVTTGSPVESPEWTFAAGSTAAESAESITIVNLDAEVLTEVDVLAVVGGQELPVSEMQDLVVEAGERLNLNLTRQIKNRDDLAIVVRATEPIVVERVLAELGEDQRGLSIAVGVPSPEGARVPADPVDAAADVDLGDELDEAPATDDEGIPQAPEDVELPAPDQTIVVDPDDEADASGDGGGPAGGG